MSIFLSITHESTLLNSVFSSTYCPICVAITSCVLVDSGTPSQSGNSYPENEPSSYIFWSKLVVDDCVQYIARARRTPSPGFIIYYHKALLAVL